VADVYFDEKLYNLLLTACSDSVNQINAYTFNGISMF